jgi:hypothetical protein
MALGITSILVFRKTHTDSAWIKRIKRYTGALIDRVILASNDATAENRGEKGSFPVTHRSVIAKTQ